MGIERVLVTGGAGFIGSHIVDAGWPAYVHPEAEYVRGDVRDRRALHAALGGIDVVFHYAAAVGSGISMHRIRRYVEINAVGTANLLELLEEPDVGPRKLIVPSSMTAMGEGTYRCLVHGVFHPYTRPPEQLARGQWEVQCPDCRADAEPLAMVEERPLRPTSIYGLTKKDQEEMCLIIGRARRLPTVAFRYFSVYGRRQSMSNPYTGVLARFATRVIADKPPLVFEDGRQLKDCIHVSDVVAANLRAMETSDGDYEVYNLGGGRPVSVLAIAEAICREGRVSVTPQLTGSYRVSDARHGWSDNSKAESLLRWRPKVPFEQGVADLLDWLRSLPREELARSIETFSRLEAEAEARGYAT